MGPEMGPPIRSVLPLLPARPGFSPRQPVLLLEFGQGQSLPGPPRCLGLWEDCRLLDRKSVRTYHRPCNITLLSFYYGARHDAFDCQERGPDAQTPVQAGSDSDFLYEQ